MNMLRRCFRQAAMLAPVLLGMFVLLAQTDVSAQSSKRVTLKSFDGFTQLKGDLLEFDGETFTIQTTLGVIKVDALQVECEGPGCPQDPMFGGNFAIRGSNTIGSALMPALIQGYADSLDAELLREITAVENRSTFRIIHPNGNEMAAIDLAAGGGDTAFAALASGEAALAMSSSRITAHDARKLRAAGQKDPRGTPAEQILALDGLIAIVHPANPLASISADDLARVFSGNITNWKQLGGPDRPISVLARDKASGTMSTFNALVLKPKGLRLTSSAQRVADNAQLSDLVAGNPDAIGFVPLAYARAAKPLAIRLSCGILARPSTFAVKTEEYPLSRRLYLYLSTANETVHARNLAAFALSDAAQPIIEEQGFVSRALETRTLDQLGGRVIQTLLAPQPVRLPLLQEMLGELRDATRLSLAFRFDLGSSRLDPKSESEAHALATMLSTGAFDGKEVMLIGFTDSVGEVQRNLSLSKKRAEEVLDAMRASVAEGALENSNISVRGYGELTPVRCNDTLAGQQANRRVEVWVRDLPG